MTKKDYESAAQIVQEIAPRDPKAAYEVREAFARLFETDSTRFDRGRFNTACEPGANVAARPKRPKYPYEASEE